MSKRILSICLALAVMLVALPVLPISFGANAAAPGEANPVFTPAQLPETVVDRVIANFDGETDQVGQTNYNWEGYFPTYQAYTYSGTNTTKNESIVDGAYKVEFTAFNSANYPTTHIFIDPRYKKNPTTDTTALRFHIDTTGMVSDGVGTEVSVRLTLTTSNGTSGVSDKFFVIDGKTWYFTPDATDENPNPETIVKTTRNATSVWNCYWDVPTGVSGTVVIPMDAFFYDENSRVTDYTLGADYWPTYVSDNATDWRHQSSISFNLRDAGITAGDWFSVDSFEWIKEAPFNYQLQTVTQDFESFTPNGNWTWIYGNYSCYGNNPGDALPFSSVSVSEGRFTVTPADTATDGSRLHLTIDDIGVWKESYKAFSFDLDTSAQKGANNICLRPKLVGRMNIDGTRTETSFAPSGGHIYLYNEVDGVFTKLPLGDGNTQFTIPEGFKGKVIYTADIWNAYSGTGSLHDNFTELGLIVEITNWRSAYTGTSYYIDNFTYYLDVEGPETGYNFATDKVGYESNGVISDTINTVETWVKTSATTAGTIFSEKYNYPTKNYAEGYESFQIAMNAAGNPVVYLSAGDGTAHFIDWTIDSVTINDGKWNHLAVVVDQEAKAVKFYLNGTEAASKAFDAFAGVEMARPIVLGHTINNSLSIGNWFDGEIAGVAVYGDARNSGEIMLDVVGGADESDANLLAYWELAGSIDDTLKAYDLKVTPEDEKYNKYVQDITDGSYTIAFLPDTQIVNRDYSDDVTEFDYFNNIYTWIIDNADDYNIKAVLGLGDITDTNDTQTSDKWKHVDYEWENARNAFDRLSAAGIPWAIVQGNHDYNSLGARHANKFAEYFPMSVYDNAAWSDSQFKLGGAFYPEEYGYTPENQADLSSAYYYLNVDEDADYEYMILCLEHEAGIGTIEWAHQVIQKNSDKKVIITTHGYMDPNATRVQRNDFGLYHDALLYTGGAAGEELWNSLVSKYANIEMVVCGHLSCPDIITRVDKGVNGNDVLQVLMDAQGLDASPENPVAMVGLATYNADGSIVSFKYVATRDYRTETGEGAYFYDDNSNELEFNLGAVTAPYVDKSVDNSANIEADGLFNGGTIIRDFQGSFTTGNLWWGSSNISGAKFEYTGRKKEGISMADFESIPYKWVEGRIKRGPVAEGNTVYFKGLPNFTPIDGETVKAISIHLENPASVAQHFRISLGVPYMSGHNLEVRNYDNNYAYSTKIYLVSDNGAVTVGGNSTWATTVPANFSGTMIIPLDNNYCQWGGEKGSGNYLWTAEDFKTDVAGNQVVLQFNAQGASCKTNDIYFDNIAYHTALGSAFTAPVKDKNGTLVGFEAVKDGASIDESKLVAPEKYGMIFKDWANIDNPAAAAIDGIYPIYEKDTTNTYTVNATNGTVQYPGTQTSAYYNDRVVISAPATSEGKIFQYWQSADGSIFSYSNRVSFLAFADVTFTAVYGDAPVDEKVVLFTAGGQPTVGESTYDMHVMGAVYVPDGTTVKEIGVLLSASEMDAAAMKAGYEANNGTVVKLRAKSAEANKQFIYTIKGIAKGQIRTALTYAILSDGTVVYGDASYTANVQ